MTKQIIVENDGPVKRLTFSAPEEGGVVELLGYHGVGKSHVLNALQQTISHGKNVPARDGTSAAEVEVFGVTARFGRRSTYSGELTCEVLEGKFNLGDLIDPGLQNPQAADSRRIKALIQLATGEEVAKPELFYELLPGGKEEFELEVSLRAQSETDVVNMAAQVKRDLEAAARRDAELAEKARLSYEANKAAVADIDLTAIDDEQVLAAEHEKAVKSLGSLVAEANSINQAKRKAGEAQEKLNSLEKAGSVSDAISSLKSVSDYLETLMSERRKLEQRLHELAIEINAQETLVSNAGKALKSAELHEELAVAWQADIDEAARLEPITDEQLAEAQAAVDKSRHAIETGALVRRAKLQLTQATENKNIAKELKKKSEQLRSAAQATDTVLSKIVQQLDCPLRVSRGRLVTDTDRGEEVFDDLSDGERVKLAIPIAVNAVKRQDRNGLLVISQRHWQDLSPDTRRLIAELVEGTGVVIVTARATDDQELYAARLEAEPALMP